MNFLSLQLFDSRRFFCHLSTSASLDEWKKPEEAQTHRPPKERHPRAKAISENDDARRKLQPPRTRKRGHSTAGDGPGAVDVTLSDVAIEAVVGDEGDPACDRN